MTSVISTNWLVFAGALAIGLAVAWWLWGRTPTAPDRHRTPDALDKGAAPARRNQALIDAPRDFASSAVSQRTATAAATEGTHRLLLLPLLLLPARTDGCPLVSDWDCLLHGV